MVAEGHRRLGHRPQDRAGDRPPLRVEDLDDRVDRRAEPAAEDLDDQAAAPSSPRTGRGRRLPAGRSCPRPRRDAAGDSACAGESFSSASTPWGPSATTTSFGPDEAPVRQAPAISVPGTASALAVTCTVRPGPAEVQPSHGHDRRVARARRPAGRPIRGTGSSRPRSGRSGSPEPPWRASATRRMTGPSAVATCVSVGSPSSPTASASDLPSGHRAVRGEPVRSSRAACREDSKTRAWPALASNRNGRRRRACRSSRPGSRGASRPSPAISRSARPRRRRDRLVTTKIWPGERPSGETDRIAMDARRGVGGDVEVHVEAVGVGLLGRDDRGDDLRAAAGKPRTAPADARPRSG